jgi:hypothetical protein
MRLTHVTLATTNNRQINIIFQYIFYEIQGEKDNTL